MSKKTGSQLQKIVIIVGPTASGKSDLAVRVARKIGGEIISADSRQVYRGMDIGTGKITKKEMRGIPHHLLDVVLPKTDFNVSHFKKLTAKKIGEIVKQGKIPIIVGGTGFWIDALIYDWPIPEVGPNRALRARLEKWPAARLYAKLQKLDPNRAASIKTRNEVNNKRRLIRALEIVMATGKPMPEFNVASSYARIYPPSQKTADARPWRLHNRQKIGGGEYEVLILGIKLSQKKLEKRIYKRLIKRLKGGMVREIKKLRKLGVSWRRLDNFGLEYRYISRYLRGQLTYNQMVEELYRAIKNYAKRQMVWFVRNKNIHWTENPMKEQPLTGRFIG